MKLLQMHGKIFRINPKISDLDEAMQKPAVDVILEDVTNDINEVVQ